MKRKLDEARAAGVSVPAAAQAIYDRLSDLGFGRGFLPIELPKIKHGFRSGSVTIGFWNYREITILV